METTTTTTTPAASKKLFQNVKWGTFSQQLKDYNSKHKTSKVKNLQSFSRLILKHPSKFHSRTKKRAAFYKNVIAPTGKSKKSATNKRKI